MARERGHLKPHFFFYLKQYIVKLLLATISEILQLIGLHRNIKEECVQTFRLTPSPPPLVHFLSIDVRPCSHYPPIPQFTSCPLMFSLSSLDLTTSHLTVYSPYTNPISIRRETAQFLSLLFTSSEGLWLAVAALSYYVLNARFGPLDEFSKFFRETN